MLDLDLVHIQFTKSIAQDKEDVDLETYILAYEEVSKIFPVLGSVFKFVATDVDKKIGILRTKLLQEPGHYRTLNSMMKHETEARLTDRDGSNGCRTLLRLHRALG